MTSQQFLGVTKQVGAALLARPEDKIYQIYPSSQNCIYERVVRDPVPGKHQGIGIYCDLRPTLIAGRPVEMEWGPCIIAKACAPTDAPFTTARSVLWQYWIPGFTITSEDVAAVQVAFADMMVKLREAYGPIDVTDDKLQKWLADCKARETLSF